MYKIYLDFITTICANCHSPQYCLLICLYIFLLEHTKAFSPAKRHTIYCKKEQMKFAFVLMSPPSFFCCWCIVVDALGEAKAVDIQHLQPDLYVLQHCQGWVFRTFFEKQSFVFVIRIFPWTTCTPPPHGKPPSPPKKTKRRNRLQEKRCMSASDFLLKFF
jgi:hypothetical protein